jgi:hypothetical protein
MSNSPIAPRPIVLGPKIWVPALCLLIAFFMSGLWLRRQTGWPDTYGWHCRSGCYIAELWHSPSLLGQGIAADLLFAHLWFLPALWIIGMVARPFFRRKR